MHTLRKDSSLHCHNNPSHLSADMTTVRKRNNLTTSVTLLDELPVSDLFFTDKEPGIFHIETVKCTSITFCRKWSIPKQFCIYFLHL